MHVRNDTRPSAFCATENGAGLGSRLIFSTLSNWAEVHVDNVSILLQMWRRWCRQILSALRYACKLPVLHCLHVCICMHVGMPTCQCSQCFSQRRVVGVVMVSSLSLSFPVSFEGNVNSYIQLGCDNLLLVITTS